ncbi:hypothetical protein SCHPADRAFT_860669 [Schizopora paradoxa]|uniref:Pyridoxamine 5'-phosphate oxidase N-terminal domain-containing protein n=1 Tax=Schizopora paradoxa TaxID=27342 RepID=A0A0H2RC52_9AGAM|nr:hypothetical protein SCHPADRAFT_860669 [Schizopora paradoxa]
MGQFFDSIPPNLVAWIQNQHLFWVASAPLDANGHVNVSPKGTYDCFHVVGPNKVWYEDLTGSGNETISHMRENGRMTIMFNAFEGPPRIVRLFGKGTIHEYGTPEYDELIPEGKRKPGSRAAIVLDIHKVGSSCGYTVPYYEFKGDRSALLEYLDKCEKSDQAFEATGTEVSTNKAPGVSDDRGERAEKGLRAYWLQNNVLSMDGLPGITTAPYAKPTPRSTWKLEGKPEMGKYDNVTSDTSTEVHKRTIIGDHETKLVAAFSLGVLVTMLSIKLSTRLSSLIV